MVEFLLPIAVRHQPWIGRGLAGRSFGSIALPGHESADRFEILSAHLALIVKKLLILKWLILVTIVTRIGSYFS